MLAAVQKSTNDKVHIVLSNLGFSATPDDIYDFYDPIDFEATLQRPGVFTLEFFEKEEAMKFIKKGTGVRILWLIF